MQERDNGNVLWWLAGALVGRAKERAYITSYINYARLC